MEHTEKLPAAESAPGAGSASGKYDPVEALRTEVERFKATNRFTPMLVTGFYIQAGVVLSQYERLENQLAATQAELDGADKVIVHYKARVEKLESYLDKTADGKLVVECMKLYCPKCSGEVRCEYMNAYCDECPNPDGGDWPYTPPLPLSYGACLSTPRNT